MVERICKVCSDRYETKCNGFMCSENCRKIYKSRYSKNKMLNPEVRKRIIEYQREYHKRPEVKRRTKELLDKDLERKQQKHEYVKQYNKRPEVKERYRESNRIKALIRYHEKSEQNREKRNTPEAILKRKLYYQKNKERIKQYQQMPEVLERKRLLSKTQERKEKMNIRRQTSYFKFKRARYQQKREALKKRVFEKFTIKEAYEKRNKQNGICLSCLKNVGQDGLTLDHIKPLDTAPFGFVYTINDIQFLCMSCNSSKGTKEISYEVNKNAIELQ